MNKMAEVVKSIGVEIGREFLARTTYHGIRTYKINEEGIWCQSDYSDEWNRRNEDLYKLVTGEYVIIQKP